MNILNINIGILGHVDSGKTSLCKALSTIASTACFDKNPQSKERGITLDLGFSSFKLDTSQISQEIIDSLQLKNESSLQFTLVDCPGHASLIRTIICGAQIIDTMILVIDVTKGIQTQTAECLIIGEILCNNMIIVLNKVDLLPEKEREMAIAKMKKRLTLTFSKTKFLKCPIVEISANPGGCCEEVGNKIAAIGIDNLIAEILKNIENPTKKRLEGCKDPLIFAVDHCFTIRGQGTIMTGTVLSGTIEVGDTLSIPILDIEKKVKSMQIFKQPVTKALQGDRVGVCVTQMDASLLERGLLCKVSSNPPLSIIEACIIKATSIRYFKSEVKSKAKFHFTIGHDTVMGSITLFTAAKTTSEDFDWTNTFEYLESYSTSESLPNNLDVFILIQLEKPAVCAKRSLIIGSKLDSDIHSNTCRLAFYGHVLWMNKGTNYREVAFLNLKIFKKKSRIGTLERLNDNRTAIVKNLFKKETNIEAFQRMLVKFVPAEQNNGDLNQYFVEPLFGYIEGNFGQSGKCRVMLKDDFPMVLFELFSGTGKKKKNKSIEDEDNKIIINVVLEFKRYIFDNKKKMIQ